MHKRLRRRSGEVLLGLCLLSAPAYAQTPPILVCAEDMSCVPLDELLRNSRALVASDSSPIVTAPSGGIRVLIGGEAGSSFGNLFAGVTAKVEIPVNRHLEIDLRDNFQPLEEHIALGRGWANQVSGGGIVWLTQSMGVNGYVEHSQYRVSISKHAEYAAGGITLRKSIQGLPVRLGFDYLRQVNNGIDSTGTESSHLQAGQFNLDLRIGCAGPFCYRTEFDYKIGHVLTQGNPVCDGSFGGSVTCPRGGASSGAFTASVMLEFPRRRATESLPF